MWRQSNPIVVGLRSYSPKAERDAAEGDGEVGADDIKKKEDERRMNFSFAVSEMIAMAPHTKQLLLQASSASFYGFDAGSARDSEGFPFSWVLLLFAVFVIGSCEIRAGPSSATLEQAFQLVDCCAGSSLLKCASPERFT